MGNNSTNNLEGKKFSEENRKLMEQNKKLAE